MIISDAVLTATTVVQCFANVFASPKKTATNYAKLHDWQFLFTAKALILRRIFFNDDLPYLLRCLFLFFLQPVRQQRFIYANGALRRMIVDEARMQTFVSKGLIAVAITW